MEMFSSRIREGNFVLNEKNYSIKWTTKQIENGWKITGFIKGKPGRIEFFKTYSSKKILINNWQSWGPCKVINTDHFKLPRQIDDNWQYTASLFPDIFEKQIQSDYFILEENKLYGFLSSRIAHPFFTVQKNAMTAYIDYFDAVFDEYVPLETFVILEGADESFLLEKYGELIAKENNVSIRKQSIIGWCSWYQYFLNLTWQEILKNINLASNYPFEVFQIDDGYEKDIGDWLIVKDGFPQLYQMAETIAKNGMKPGIWIAPFCVSESSSISQNHPDWLVKEEGGPKVAFRNWDHQIFSLDLSKSEVKKWLYELFSTLRKMGYLYFKIDFLFSGAILGKRHNGSTPIQVFREGLEVIRKAVKDAFILGCGSPLLPAVGFVDGMRVGPDTTPFWGENVPDEGAPAAKWSLRNAITRHFMHRKLWLNDPDCLLLRSEQTSLTLNERELYAYTCGVLDNIIVVSDDLSLIDDQSKEILNKTLRLISGSAFVKNIMSTDGYEIISRGTKSGDVKLFVDLEKRIFSLEIKTER